MYSKTMIANQTRASKSEPKARLPKLYLNVQYSPFIKEALPLVSEVDVKYQTHAATIMTNCVHAIIMARIHKSPKNRYIMKYLSVSSHTSFLYWVPPVIA
jgi:hypothetical protein